MVFNEGFKICINPWRKDLCNFNMNSEAMHEVSVSIMGLPYYIWSLRDAETLGNALGRGLVEADRECTRIVRMNLFQIKIRLK